MRRWLLDRPVWAAISAVAGVLLADLLSGGAHAAGWFTVLLTALYGWILGGMLLARPARTPLIATLRGVLLIALALLALPAMSGLVQLPRTGLAFLPEVVANTAFELRRQWPAMAIVGAALGLLDHGIKRDGG